MFVPCPRMSLRFSLYNLRKDELQHELRIRGFESTPEQTVKDLRTCLGKFMKMESGNRSFSYPQVKLDSQVELDSCSGKYLEIMALRGNPGVSFQTLYSRLVHVSGRLARLSVDEVEQSRREEFLKLRTSVAAALDELKSVPVPGELTGTSEVAGNSGTESDSDDSVGVQPRPRGAILRSSTRNSLAVSTSAYNLQK